MARTYQGPGALAPTATTERRPQRALQGPPSTHFYTDLGLVYVEQIDDDAVILLPPEYIHDPDDSPSAAWREDTVYQQAPRVWQATALYEKIGELHPRLIPFIRRDPWTAFPVIGKPSGPPLSDFLEKHISTMYSHPLDLASCRINLQYRPLIYQWCLQLLAGLGFLHNHDVFFGEVATSQCWLSSGLSISLAGLVNAGTIRWNGHATLSEDFHAYAHKRGNAMTPTKQTDLFMWGALVYELMTGFRPGTRPLKSSQEVQAMVIARQWPALEEQFLGEIVRKCWDGGYRDAAAVRADVIGFIESEGYEVEGEDLLKGLDIMALFPAEEV